VALVPEAVSKLKTIGFDIAVERGAGVAASFPDDAYAEAGAELVEEVWDAAGIVKVRKPDADEVRRLREGQLLIGFLEPLTDPRPRRRCRATRRLCSQPSTCRGSFRC